MSSVTDSSVSSVPKVGSAEHALKENQVFLTLLDAIADDDTFTTYNSIEKIVGPKKVGIAVGGAEPLYWVDKKTDIPTILKFPALLSTSLTESRLSPYFSNSGHSRMSDKEFKKTKAIFELRPLPDNDAQPFPLPAIQSSHAAMGIIRVLQSELEEKRSQGMAKNLGGFRLYKWDREYGPPHDTDAFVVQTDPLFSDVPESKPSPSSPTSSRKALLSGQGLLSSPSKRKASAAAIESDNPLPANSVGALMPDPHGIYEQLFHDYPHLAAAIVRPPDVRGQNGCIIHPRNYASELEDLTPVIIEVYLRLWDIAPNKPSNNTQRGGNRPATGSRTYQLLLKSMQLLPVDTSETVSPLTPDNTKRRRSEGPEVGPRKKRARSDLVDKEGDDGEDRGGGEGTENTVADPDVVMGSSTHA